MGRSAVKNPSAENQKGIENHKRAASHLQEAAKHHENGDEEKAAHSTLKAQGYHSLATEAQREDVRHHALL